MEGKVLKVLKGPYHITSYYCPRGRGHTHTRIPFVLSHHVNNIYIYDVIIQRVYIHTILEFIHQNIYICGLN